MPKKPMRVPTIKLNKKPDYLLKQKSTLKSNNAAKTDEKYIDEVTIDSEISKATCYLENQYDINPPKFRLESIFDVIFLFI